MMLTQRRRVRFDLTDHTAKPRFVDGQELPHWQDGPEMAAYIRKLMHDGWHLAAGNSRVLVFERSVPRAVTAINWLARFVRGLEL